MRAFIDFEASSLAKEGYPIEVAWVFEDGREESYLIRPLPGWTDWDEAAAAVHGIPRAMLEAEGLPVATVGARTLAALGGHEVYASSPSWDGKWLSVLLRGAGLPRHALRLKDTDEAQLAAAVAALAPAMTAHEAAASARDLVAQVRALYATGPVAHRALPDARQEWLLWREIGRRAAVYAASRRPGGPAGAG